MQGGYQRMVTRPVTNETALFRRCFQPQVSKGVSTETCQNLTFEAVCKDAVRGLVRTESGALAQVSAGRLAPWLARKQGAGKQRGKQEIGRLRGLDRAGYAPSVCSLPAQN